MTISTKRLPCKERPIIFSGSMVQAILDGRKTETRRPIKPQPDDEGLAKMVLSQQWEDTGGKVYKCKYGQAGDLLWVREPFRLPDCHDDIPPAWAGVEMGIEEGEPASRFVNYKNTNKEMPYSFGSWGKWRSSLHMPRWASRIDLRVISVRAKRLYNLSEDDARAEGAETRIDFSKLWQSIYFKKPGCAWEDNPWVWVVGFEVITP